MKYYKALVRVNDLPDNGFYDSARDWSLRRLCSCGCDRTTLPSDAVGYINVLGNGKNVTIVISDPELYAALEKATAA